MAWTANELARETGLTQRTITRYFQRGEQAKKQDPNAQSAYNQIVGELKSFGWLADDTQGELFLDAFRKVQNAD